MGGIHVISIGAKRFALKLLLQSGALAGERPKGRRRGRVRKGRALVGGTEVIKPDQDQAEASDETAGRPE